MQDKEWFGQIAGFFEEKIAFDRYLGMRVPRVERGEVEFLLPFRPEFLGDPFRPALHGGVVATLIDAAAGAAALSTLPRGSLCSTLDMRVDYLLPGQPQDLRAQASVIRTGNSVAVVNVEVHQAQDLIATGRAVFSLRPAGVDGS